MSVDHFLTPINISTDISVLPFENIRSQANLSFSDQKVATIIPYVATQTEFFRNFLRVDRSEQRVTRQVMSLDDFLSFLGGIFTILELIGALILTPYARFSLLMDIFNKLFYVDKDLIYTEKP